MRLVMMGTGPFAVPTFRGLYQTAHEVAALVVRPPHGARSAPSPMPPVARQFGTPVLQPEDINAADARDELRRLAADLFVVCDYGQILAPATLAEARLGGINLHGSLLPKYRGAAPVNWALFHGETETGVTVIHMTPAVDAGPSIAHARLAIDPAEDAVALEARLAELGAPLVAEAIELLAAGRAVALPQDPARASRAPRLKKSDGAIDWSRPAAAIHNQLRAMEPWPKCYTHWRRGGEPLRLIVVAARVVELPAAASPGQVVEAGPRLVVAAGHGGLELLSVQPAGKKALGAAEFLRGYRLTPGDHLTTDH